MKRSDLHQYQLDAIEFLKAGTGRQLVAVMGSGKTAVALHAIADLKQAGGLDGPVLVVAPLMIAETVWASEAALWQDTAGLTVELVLGSAKQRQLALDRPADIYVINYDNLKWLVKDVLRRNLTFSVLIADESSRPSTCKSKVGCAAIEEPCTKRIVPAVPFAVPAHFSNMNSFTLSSFVVQCSSPRIAVAAATSFIIHLWRLSLSR